MSTTRTRTLTKSSAAREYGITVDALNQLIAAGVVRVVRIPNRKRPRVVRDGLDRWVADDRPAPERRVVALMPREL